ncbi:2-hydroxyacyl-CoA dehydratase [Chloroflexota bacterium]
MTDADVALEEQLKVWRKATSEDNRFRVARELKKQGRKVIGVISDYVPEEAIYAAGMLPWRIMGTWREDAAQATLHRPVNAEVYTTHVLESLLAGELDFLDGIVVPHLDDDQRRLWDVCVHLDMMPLIHYLYIPRKESEFCLTEFAEGIRRLVGELEKLGTVKVSEESLRQAIDVYNKWRRCLMEIYELRKREVPPLSGSEVLGITTASFTMLKEELTQQVEVVFDQLKKRKTSLSQVRPRILVSSENLDDPAYLELVEDAGCLVAMDDLDTGSRYIWQQGQYRTRNY